MKYTLRFCGFAFYLIGIFGAATISYGQNHTNSNVKSDCSCPNIGLTNPGFRYYNGLSSTTHYSSLQDATGWTYLNKKASFDTLFTRDTYYVSTSRSGASTGNMFVLSPRQPIRLVHPGNTFVINFTPCKNANGIYELPVNVRYEHPILNDIKDFNLTKFDYTTLSFVKLILEASRKRPDEIIRYALTAQATAGDGGIAMNRSIEIINREFETGIPPVTARDYYDTTRISGVLDSLVSKKVRQANVINAAFIQSLPGTHRITQDEQYKLSILFYRFYPPIEIFSQFETKKLLPHIDARIGSSKAIIEISSSVLSQPDRKQGSAFIWSNFDDAQYTSEKELEMEFSSVCLPTTFIAGTKIGIAFTNAVLVSSQKQEFNQLDYGLFPQFVSVNRRSSGTQRTQQGDSRIRYDSLLTNFSGLFIKSASLRIGEHNKQITIQTTDVLINNTLIAGRIVVKLLPANLNKVVMNYPEGEQQFSVITFLAMLKKQGLRTISTRIVSNQLYVYFKKVIL